MRRDRQIQIVERKKKKERLEKNREKRHSQKDIENMNLLLIEAKMILGLI